MLVGVQGVAPCRGQRVLRCVVERVRFCPLLFFPKPSLRPICGHARLLGVTALWRCFYVLVFGCYWLFW